MIIPPLYPFHVMKRLTFPALLAVLCLPTTHGQDRDIAKVSKYATPVPYAGSRIWHITQNLGPTGARGWLLGKDGHSNDSREILIKSVEPGSPADGILQPYDVITGAAVPPETPASGWKTAPEVKPFDSDARLSMGRAVTWAESDAGKGELKLLRSRNGEPAEIVTIKLPVMGTYADAMPMECPKSRAIVDGAARFLAANMPAGGFTEGVGDPHNAGFLLATHEPEYLDHVRRSAIRMSELHTISDAGHETWRWGNTNTFLCEYYLATGDARVLPTIREYCQRLQDGQCNPGTWGHRVVPNFIPPGYGSVNSTGIICFYSLVLANQCGVHNADQAIERSIGFYGGYAGRGAIPYGDHEPVYDSTTNGGKSGTAALAFHLLGAKPAAQWFARLSASSNLVNFEGGHSGNYFNQTWTPLGVQVAGDENYIEFWKRFHWYRDLARRRDGSFIAQPWPHGREGDLGTGNYVNKGPMWSTGSYALSYLAGSERLAMLGRVDSVFAESVPGELDEALRHFRAKEFDKAAGLAADLEGSSNGRVATLAAQLQGVARRNLASIDLTLADMARNLEIGDLYLVKHQLLGIESLLDPADERLKPFRSAVEDPDAEKILQAGAQYDRGLRGISMTGERGFQTVLPDVSGNGRRFLQPLARHPDGPYGKLAAARLEAHPDLARGAGQALIELKAKPAEATVENLKLGGEFVVEDPATIGDLYFSYTMGKKLKVLLNNTPILDFTVDRPDARPVNILLKSVTAELLEDGRNVLSIEVTPGGPGFQAALKKGR